MSALTRTAAADGWRMTVLVLLVFLGWTILFGRLIRIQGAQRILMHDRVARQSITQEPIAARPAEILDRHGHVLAMTITRESVFAVPEMIDDPLDFAWKVGSALNLNADAVYRRLTEQPDSRFLWLRRRVSDERLNDFLALGLPRASWGLRREYQRQYPQGAIAAHVLGIRDIDNVGRGGLEEALNSGIRGTDGVRVISRDARSIVVEVAAERSVPPQHGRTVISTLDLLIQSETERQLDQLVEQWRPLGACAIVMDPATGEILAMASRPTFDPGAVDQVPAAAWKNLNVAAVFEPGSTFKPFVVGWALQQNLLKQDETIHCGFGTFRMGRRILHDHHAYGDLSVEDILVKSSNIGMARIAERLGPASLYEATLLFGFGRRTGVELPGELSGLLRPLSAWTDYSAGSIPMGQELAVTPLQLITAHAAIANGGLLLRPRLVRTADTDGSEASPLTTLATAVGAGAVESRTLSREVCEWLVRNPMRQVVERGTGKTAKIDGMQIFGKTGTAQKWNPETGTYADDAWVLSFVCGAPAEDPRTLVLVMVDQPQTAGSHSGGSVAAPTASRILQYAVERHVR